MRAACEDSGCTCQRVVLRDEVLITDWTEFRALTEIWKFGSIHPDHPRLRGEQTGLHWQLAGR